MGCGTSGFLLGCGSGQFRARAPFRKIVTRLPARQNTEWDTLCYRPAPHGFVNIIVAAAGSYRQYRAELDRSRQHFHQCAVTTKFSSAGAPVQMLRGLFLSIAAVFAGPALAAGDIDSCRDAAAEPAARLAACETVIADDKISGKSKAMAFSVRGDALKKKRDYDGAIAAFNAALDIDADNVGLINLRGTAYSDKGDDEHALADFDHCVKLRPNFASAFNNRGLIFMRRGDLDRAFEDFNSAVRFVPSGANRYVHLYNRARVQTLRKQYDAALAD